MPTSCLVLVLSLCACAAVYCGYGVYGFVQVLRQRLGDEW